MFVNYAHRGASQYRPENTLISFRYGLEQGANGIELDLQETKDGKIVVFHDDSIDNKSNGMGKIADYTYEELLKMDFGAWKGAEFAGTPICLFEDFAKEFLGLDLTFAIELKAPNIEKQTLEIIEKYKKHDNIYISSFQYDILKAMRKLDKKVKISWLIQEPITKENILKLLDIGGTQICPEAKDVTKESIALAKHYGLGVRLWGVYNEEIMKNVYALPTEGMTVNFPDKLTALMKEQPKVEEKEEETDFLACPPTVFVIGNEYEILAYANYNGIFCVKVGDTLYYEANAGVLASEKPYAKIRIPQAVLNSAKSYEIVYREAYNRKGYFSVMGKERRQAFAFKPMEKTENIHIYHLADVHYCFDTAAQTAKYFGDDTDLFIFNGDIGEVEKVDHYLETICFVGKVSQGKIPVVYTRGNHDTRGKLAEKFVDHYPSNGYNTYYTFELGALSGIVFDLGEDKKDTHYDEQYPNPWVYNGVNNFHAFRQRELAWLKQQQLPKDKVKLAIGHICPVKACNKAGAAFDIERECYGAMSKEFERIGIDCMLTGHIHHAYVLQPNDENSFLPHNYPVVVGSKLFRERYAPGGRVSVEKFYGAAITVNKNEIEVLFTDQNFEIYERHVLPVIR